MLLSGHKMFALEGIGALIAKQSSAKFLSPTQFEGGVEASQYPCIFEPGTLNTASIISLQAGVRYIQEQGIDIIEDRVSSLTLFARSYV